MPVVSPMGPEMGAVIAADFAVIAVPIVGILETADGTVAAYPFSALPLVILANRAAGDALAVVPVMFKLSRASYAHMFFRIQLLITVI